MTTTRSAIEIWLINNSKSDLNNSCLPTHGDVMRSFLSHYKNQNTTANDAIKRTIEAVTEISASTKLVIRAGQVRKLVRKSAIAD